MIGGTMRDNMDIIKINNRLNEQKDVIISDLVSQIEILHRRLNEKEFELETLKLKENNKEEQGEVEQVNSVQAIELEILKGKCAKLEMKVATLNGIIDGAKGNSSVALSKELYTCKHDLTKARAQHSAVQSKLDRFYNYLKGKGKAGLVEEFLSLENGENAKTIYTTADSDKSEEEVTFGTSMKDMLAKVALGTGSEVKETEANKEKPVDTNRKTEEGTEENKAEKKDKAESKAEKKDKAEGKAEKKDKAEKDTKCQVKNEVKASDDVKKPVEAKEQKEQKQAEEKVQEENKEDTLYTYDWESRSFWLHDSESNDTYLKPIQSLERAGALGIDGDITGYYVET